MSEDYRLCAECGLRRWSAAHRMRNIRLGDHPFKDPRAVGIGQPRPPVLTFAGVLDIEGRGYVEAGDPLAKPAEVGDHAVVYARGNWRLGIIDKIGRTLLHVAVATPTSPELVTHQTIGGKYGPNGYLLSTVPYERCGATGDPKWMPGAVCRLHKGHAKHHRGLPGRDGLYDQIWTDRA